MSAVRNVLFIMCDQLRADHLSCYGHPALETPNIDALAARGVKFDRAYASSPVCGPSRMSFYTGRSVTSHGATWNRVPLSLRELTLGDYLAAAGRRAVLAGKTHVLADLHGFERFGIELESERGLLMREGGFVPIDRYDGHSPPGSESGYPAYLRERGYVSDDPWTDFVIATEDDRGRIYSGWQMRNVHLPARVKEEDSETAYMTRKAIEFIRGRGNEPWVLHLSLVKPHWPYVAPAPYHALYAPGDALPVRRSAVERERPHPVHGAFQQHQWCRSFARDEVIERVRPVYMGLVKQVDDHIGRLVGALEQLGRFEDTLVIFTSDHGEFGGDHWLGEKELFFEEAARIPLVLVDPDARADATRGSTDMRFVEAIDVLPTILDALGVPGAHHLVEGRSLLPLARSADPGRWRDLVVSELDYSFNEARRLLGRHPGDCHGWMVRTERWKYIHWQGFRPQLFDLEHDPYEFIDLGGDTRCEPQLRGMRERLLQWMSERKLRTTLSDEEVEAGTNAAAKHGIHIGVW
ncbi:MAG: phosphonate monoester hydrolase [Betaproteobacteria bacterium RIFCSPLOWO2_12_FULL_63_13]|nr:MAG: phosphonate monoester hydrolase [Betaproteobacteria bacterium RIFCSPLOWO2_02_FULL_63_19]OGA45281.1 MAG: phosphonate monoester hydrolase [Betaproteobacteria bacterium RIFCSPLOWO2_12_FULL_63_13]